MIPHGSADNRVAAGIAAKASHAPRALTWGLLGPGKGIEHAIDAVALLRDRGLRVAYHGRWPDPSARARRATARPIAGLLAGAREHARCGGSRPLRLAGSCPPDALGRLIGAADVVLLPYDSLEQVTSGVLIEAVTAGSRWSRPVSRMPVELLADGAGLLVERQDPAGIADALDRVLTEPGLSARMSRHSADLAPQLLWPAVARSYRELAAALTAATAGAAV